MKVKNIEKAAKLNNSLSSTDEEIRRVKEAIYLSFETINAQKASATNLKYGGKALIEAVRILFLQFLEIERSDIMREIKKLDYLLRI